MFVYEIIKPIEMKWITLLNILNDFMFSATTVSRIVSRKIQLKPKILKEESKRRVIFLASEKAFCGTCRV